MEHMIKFHEKGGNFFTI